LLDVLTPNFRLYACNDGRGGVGTRQAKLKYAKDKTNHPSFGHPSAGWELVSERGEIATMLVCKKQAKYCKRLA
jgi:hypothetical protein